MKWMEQIGYQLYSELISAFCLDKMQKSIYHILNRESV